MLSGRLFVIQFLPLILLVLFVGCSKPPAERDALHMPPPKPVETQREDPELIEQPKQRLAMNTAEVGPFILNGTQVGNLSPGQDSSFEVRLFNAKSWPSTPRAWIGGKEPQEGGIAFGEELPGNAFQFTLRMPDPIKAGTRLWVSLTKDGKEFKGKFALQR